MCGRGGRGVTAVARLVEEAPAHRHGDGPDAAFEPRTSPRSRVPHLNVDAVVVVVGNIIEIERKLLVGGTHSPIGPGQRSG